MVTLIIYFSFLIKTTRLKPKPTNNLHTWNMLCKTNGCVWGKCDLTISDLTCYLFTFSSFNTRTRKYCYSKRAPIQHNKHSKMAVKLNKYRRISGNGKPSNEPILFNQAPYKDYSLPVHLGFENLRRGAYATLYVFKWQIVNIIVTKYHSI